MHPNSAEKAIDRKLPLHPGEKLAVVDLAPFKELVQERCGLIFDEVQEERLSQAIALRMNKTGRADGAAYLSLLGTDRDEFHHFVDHLTVNETYFFRDPQYLGLLAERLFPERLSALGGVGPVRILSAGCSTGEEPYSIVLALTEKFGASVGSQIRVIGVDIDGKTLERAAEGVYQPLSFRGCDPALKERHFLPAGDRCLRISPQVRRQVHFARLNLLAPVYPHHLAELDVVFYRNVSIYFDRRTQGVIFAKLAGLLRDGGFLVVSPSETFSHDGGLLTLIERDGLFLFQKGVARVGKQGSPAGAPSLPPSAKSTPARRWPVAAVPAASAGPATTAVGLFAPVAGPQAHHDRALALARAKRYQEALALLEEPSGADRALSLALKAAILLNLRRPVEADQAAQACIDCDRWRQEGYLLLGLSAHLRHDDEAAVRRFKEALYVRSACWLAHFYLAEIYRGLADRAKARREYAIVLKQLSLDGAGSEALLEFFPLSCTLEQLGHLCRHHLELLEQGGE